jgi:hypothetical protein
MQSSEGNRHEPGKDSRNDSRLSELFLAYRDACVIPEPTAGFMPGLWARVEARERSGNFLGRLAKGFVTAALAASALLGLLVSFEEANAPLNGTYIEAVAADHVATLEPFHLERISELEFQ